MNCQTSADGWVNFRSVRCDRRHTSAEFTARYRPVQSIANSGVIVDPLANWLTARFCLYTADRLGRIRRCEIDHAPWPLEAAEAQIEACTLGEAVGITLPDCEPLLHFTRRLDTVAWTLDLLR